MVFEAFLDKQAQAEVHRQNMEGLGKTRDWFLMMLADNGVESSHGFGEFLVGEATGRKMTTVKLAARGDWVERSKIQVEISVPVTKDRLKGAKKKPTVSVKVTFPDDVRTYFIPDDVNGSHAQIEDRLGDRTSSKASSCVGLAEVMEYFQAGKLAVVRE